MILSVELPTHHHTRKTRLQQIDMNTTTTTPHTETSQSTLTQTHTHKHARTHTHAHTQAPPPLPLPLPLPPPPPPPPLTRPNRRWKSRNMPLASGLVCRATAAAALMRRRVVCTQGEPACNNDTPHLEQPDLGALPRRHRNLVGVVRLRAVEPPECSLHLKNCGSPSVRKFHHTRSRWLHCTGCTAALLHPHSSWQHANTPTRETNVMFAALSLSLTAYGLLHHNHGPSCNGVIARFALPNDLHGRGDDRRRDKCSCVRSRVSRDCLCDRNGRARSRRRRGRRGEPERQSARDRLVWCRVDGILPDMRGAPPCVHSCFAPPSPRCTFDHTRADGRARTASSPRLRRRAPLSSS
jgi:hypothetical protein